MCCLRVYSDTISANISWIISVCDSLVESWLCALIVVRVLFDVVLELLDVVDVDLDVAGCDVEVE